MRSLRNALLAGFVLLLPGCVLASITTPLDTDVAATELGSRRGESSFQSIMGLVAWGDAGTQAAARSADITTIRHMDRHQFLVLFGLYYKNTTIVYGD